MDLDKGFMYYKAHFCKTNQKSKSGDRMLITTKNKK